MSVTAIERPLSRSASDVGPGWPNADQALVKTRLYGRALPTLAAAALQYRAAQAQCSIDQCKMA
jgi:hypothetical protein